jgi:cytochrome c oxidase accessory protein FixG
MKHKGDHRDTLYTIDKRGKRKWVYAHIVFGPITRLRFLVGWFLVIFYLALPWVTIGGKQGVLLDIPHRRFIFFGFELWATDTIFLFLTLATLGLSLFFFTAILGRVWCGWACPETVFLEYIFRPIERLIEGSDSERRRLDTGPWSVEKVWKKLLKHSICAAVSWVLASTALAYFIGREPLLAMMTGSPLDNLGPFLITLVIMALFAFQFGWFREQFCTVLCPYARFQSVLMDPNSLLVGYDTKRGEPRGKLRAERQSTGDCIDCGMCVRVCPTGIDIRNGTQLECIACAACADACDSIMNRIGKPSGLVRYTTEAELGGATTKWIRPRLFLYSAILVGLLGTFTYLLTNRHGFDAEIVRASGHAVPYSLDAARVVSNHFSLRLSNKQHGPLQIKFELVHPSSVELVSPISQMTIPEGGSLQVPLFARIPLDQLEHGRASVIVDIVADTGDKRRREFTILGPE